VCLFRRSFCGYGFAENPLVAVRTFWGVEIPKLPVELGTSAGLLALTEGEVPNLGEIPEQLSAEIRMRNGDEGLPALTEGLAVEIDRAYPVMTPCTSPRVLTIPTRVAGG
jgi:hypothetical protein